MVQWKLILELVAVAAAITAVVVSCILMFKSIPALNREVNRLQLEVDKLERKYKDGVPDVDGEEDLPERGGEGDKKDEDKKDEQKDEQKDEDNKDDQ